MNRSKILGRFCDYRIDCVRSAASFPGSSVLRLTIQQRWLLARARSPLAPLPAAPRRRVGSPGLGPQATSAVSSAHSRGRGGQRAASPVRCLLGSTAHLRRLVEIDAAAIGDFWYPARVPRCTTGCVMTDGSSETLMRLHTFAQVKTALRKCKFRANKAQLASCFCSSLLMPASAVVFLLPPSTTSNASAVTSIGAVSTPPGRLCPGMYLRRAARHGQRGWPARKGTRADARGAGRADCRVSTLYTLQRTPMAAST